jgi:hypothetical protein
LIREDEFIKDKISDFFILGTTKSEGSLTIRSMDETDIDNTLVIMRYYFKVNIAGVIMENFFNGSNPKN